MSDLKDIDKAVAESAVDNFACDSCKSQPGEMCRTRDGKISNVPHRNRKAKAWASIIDRSPDDPKVRTRRSQTTRRFQAATKKARRVEKRLKAAWRKT